MLKTLNFSMKSQQAKLLVSPGEYYREKDEYSHSTQRHRYMWPHVPHLM